MVLSAFDCTKMLNCLFVHENPPPAARSPPQPTARCSIRPPPLADDGSLKALNFPAAVKVKKSYME